MVQVDKFFKLPFYKGELGLELEVEAKRALPRYIDDNWMYKAEGSLRGHNAEYISSAPIFNNEDKRVKIERLIKFIEPSEPITLTPRTSLHVHVNVQKHHMRQVYTAMCAYWLVENLLIKFCGEDYREGNHFCLRAIDAEWIVKAHIKDLKDQRPFYTEQVNRNLRYGGLNTCAVPRFGSLEFRAMRGTVDPNLIDMWSSELHRLVFRTKKKFQNPAEFLDNYFSFSKAELLGTLFSKEFAGELQKIDGWEDLIKQNDGLVCELAYAVDWPTYSVKNVLLQEGSIPGRRRNQPRPAAPPRVQFDDLPDFDDDMEDEEFLARMAEEEAEFQREQEAALARAEAIQPIEPVQWRWAQLNEDGTVG